MGLLSVALLPARALIGGAELLVATGRMVAPGGPVRRPGGYAERLTALLAEGGALEQLGRLGDPDGPLAHVDQDQALSEDRVLQLMDTFGRLAELQESLRAVGALAGALEALAVSTQRLPDLPEHVQAVDSRVDSIGQRLDRFEPSLEVLSGSVETLGNAAETLNELVEPLTRLAERIPGRRGRGSRD